MPKAGDAFQVMADVVTMRVTPEESDGRILVVEIAVPPSGGPPPLHRHPVDELFHVVSGSLTVFHRSSGEVRATTLGPGATTFVPARDAHTFRNLSSEAARALLVFTPGRMMYEFFTTAGRPLGANDATAIDLHAEVERVLGIGASLGLETLDEVPAPS